MKTVAMYLLGALLTVALGLNAAAVSITPGTPVYPGWTTPSSASNDVVMAQVNELLGDPLVAYKAESQQGNVNEEGPFASSYSTLFSNTSTDPSDATISYISGPKITGDDIYLLVKDGNHLPRAYLFDISGWDGESIVLEGFWPDRGAISYVAILTPTAVPDGGATVMLLGMALTGFAAFRPFGRSLIR